MAPDFEKAMSLIDAAHAKDPTLITLPSPFPTTIPYELHYANRMTHFLHLHHPHPSPLLQLAIRAQHLRRWEVPRSSYPEGKAGYFAWRTFLKKRQGGLVEEICLECGFGEAEAGRVGGLVGKEGLRKGGGDGDDEVQILEDVACLVFLDDQFEEFERGMRREGEGGGEVGGSGEGGGDEKIVGILRKTWAKMGPRGRELALEMEMSGRRGELIEKALKG